MSLGHFVLASSDPTVILDGYPIGANGDRAICSKCRRELRSGHRATVRAYRFVDTNQWDVPDVYCGVCAPERVHDPTPGALDVVATGELVMGRSRNGDDPRLHLSDVAVVSSAGRQIGRN